MRNNTISNTAQQIVLSTLNGVETEGRSVQHLEASDCDNEKRVAKLPFKKANCRVEFWRYPPILPGQSKIDNLSLYLALDSAHDPKVRDYRDKLIETFPWNNQEVKTPRS